MFFSPFDLAPYVQPGKYFTCCISYSCCLLGHHRRITPVMSEGPRKVKPVSVTLNYAMTGDHLEKCIHPSGEFNTEAQGRVVAVKMHVKAFLVENVIENDTKS